MKFIVCFGTEEENLIVTWILNFDAYLLFCLTLITYSTARTRALILQWNGGKGLSRTSRNFSKALIGLLIGCTMDFINSPIDKWRGLHFAWFSGNKVDERGARLETALLKQPIKFKF